MAKQKPLTHHQTEQLLAVYRDLSSEEKSAVAAHLIACDQCSAFAETNLQIDGILKNSAWKKPSPQLVENFYQVIESDRHSWFQTFSQLSGQFAGIALLLAVVLSTWLILRNGSVQTPIESPTVPAQLTPAPTTAAVTPSDPATRLHPLYTLTQTMSIFALSPESSYLATAETNYIYIWKTVGGELLNKIGLESAPIESLAFTPNGVNLIGRDNDGQFHRWIAFNGSYLRSFAGPKTAIGTPFALGNTTLLIVTAENNLEVWPLVGSEPNYTIELSGERVKAVAISADGQSIAAVIEDGTTLLLDDYNKSMETVAGVPEAVSGLVFTQDGRQFATYQEQANTLQLWQKYSIQLNLSSEAAAYGPLNQVLFASENQILMANHAGGFIEIWDVSSGEIITTFQSEPAVQSALGLTRNGFIYLTLDSQGLLTVWEKPEE